MIQRQLQDVIESRMFAGKAIILIGARQVGKSTLFKRIRPSLRDYLYLCFSFKRYSSKRATSLA